jgi:hypothetical protein
MAAINEVIDAAELRKDWFAGKYAITVGQGQIDGYLNFTINNPPADPPLVITCTEQTTRFTSHVYNVSNASFFIVAHRMDRGDAIAQTFFVNVLVLWP